MSQKIKIQEERRQLMNELFDLYDRKNYGYVSNKEALRIVSAMGRQIEPDEENDFFSVVDPRNEGKVTKENLLAGVETMYTIPQMYIPEIAEAFKVFDTDNDGKLSCKEFKKLLVTLTDEYKEKDVNELFKIVDLEPNGYITIEEFINAWKFQ